jgi:hypothetical protein
MLDGASKVIVASIAKVRRFLRPALYLLTLALAVFGAHRCGRVIAADEMLYGQCLRVTPGMSEDEVLAVMGAPNAVDLPADRPGVRELIYQRYDLYASGPIIIVLAENELQGDTRAVGRPQVMRTICEDIW